MRSFLKRSTSTNDEDSDLLPPRPPGREPPTQDEIRVAGALGHGMRRILADAAASRIERDNMHDMAKQFRADARLATRNVEQLSAVLEEAAYFIDDRMRCGYCRTSIENCDAIKRAVDGADPEPACVGGRARAALIAFAQTGVSAPPS